MDSSIRKYTECPSLFSKHCSFSKLKNSFYVSKIENSICRVGTRMSENDIHGSVFPCKIIPIQLLMKGHLCILISFLSCFLCTLILDALNFCLAGETFVQTALSEIFIISNWDFSSRSSILDFLKMPQRYFPRSCSSALSEYLTSSIWIWQFKTQHVRSAQCEKCLESLSTGVKSGAILAWRESGSDPNNLERKANSALLDKLTGKGRIKAGSNSGPWAPIVPFHVNRLRFSSRLDAYLFTGRFPCWFQ